MCAVALTAYLTATRNLLQNPSAPTGLYDDATLTTAINQARAWLAGDSQSIKAFGSYSITTGSQGPYPFASVVFTGASSVTGVQGVLNVRQQFYNVGTGQLWFRGRAWPWFSVYHLNSAAPDTSQGPPQVWAQYGEGETGSLYVGPQPDTTYTVKADCICVPINLVDDTTVEAIPLPWTIAIPYYAAYLALLSAQTGQRVQDAARMLQLYQTFMAGARKQTTPDIMPGNFPQNPNPVRQNQLGVSGGAQGGGG